MVAINPEKFANKIDLSKLKMLVIETNLNMDMLIRDQLAHSGFNGENVAIVSTIEDAVAILAQSQPGDFDILMTNDRLDNGKTGVEFIRDHDKDFAVKILLTGNVTKAGKIPGAENAFVVPKPYKIEELKQAIITGIADRGARPGSPG